MMRTLFALFVLLALIGCGGGGGGGGSVDLTVRTQWPTFDATSANDLAQARSVWIFVKSSSTGELQWSDHQNRPSEAGGEIVSRIDAATAGAVDVEVQAFTKIDGTGEITGSKVIHNVTLGSDVVIASLP